jgi:tetratricopeptide (TPR) repeat protein
MIGGRFARSQPISNAELEARGHLESGLALYEQGQYEAALSEFEAGYSRAESPNLLFNKGLCLRRLGRMMEASKASRSSLMPPSRMRS